MKNRSDNIDSWLGDFGDGGSSTERNPTHKYNKEGIFTVSLTISNAAGADTETKTNLIEAKLPPVPVAEFAAAPACGGAPLTVEFVDFSEPEGKIESWLWLFGDGGSSTEQNPTHTYNQRGKFTVELLVTNRAGTDNEVKRRFIKVRR